MVAPEFHPYRCSSDKTGGFEAVSFELRPLADRVYIGTVKTMTVKEAQTGFDKILGYIGNGEEVELIQDQERIAKVVPLRRPSPVSLAGSVLEERDLVSPIGLDWEAAS